MICGQADQIRRGGSHRSHRRSRHPCDGGQALGFPLVETPRHLGEQALGIFGADTVRMLGELVDNLLDRHSGAGQVPDHFGKPLAALAFVGAVLKDLAIVIIRLLRAGGVEIEQGGRLCRLAR